MSISTLPRMAVDLDGNGFPWFPFTTGADSAVLFACEPELPVRGFCWAELPDDDRRHVLLDEVSVAQLLFNTKLRAADGPTDELLCSTVCRELLKSRCDIRCYAAAVDEEYGHYPECAATRMSLCLAWAARITGSGV